MRSFLHGSAAALALALTLGVAFGGAGCAGEAPGPSEAPARPVNAASQPSSVNRADGARPPRARATDPFRAGTFNAGLAVGVLDHAEARVEPIVEALADEPLDLLCVQEFWLEEHWQKLVQATSERLPNAYRLAADPGGAPGCAPEEVGRLAACAAPCGGAGAGAARCVMDRCMGVLPSVSGRCLSCLSRDPRRPLGELVQGCLDEAPRPAPPPQQARGKSKSKHQADFYGYGGSFGTGILTSAPILERDALVFSSSTLARRGVLYAKVDAPIGPVHTFCTHLTADLGSIPHPTGGSWAADQRREIDALLAYIEAKSGGQPLVLLGDLNTGPAAAPGVSPRLPTHFQKLIAWGLQDPSTALGQPRCTYCFDNPLGGGAGTHGSLIDHVLLRGFHGVARRDLLRKPLDLTVSGRRVRTGYSDHYGVVVEIAPESG